MPDNDDDLTFADASADLWLAEDASDETDWASENERLREVVGEFIDPEGESMEERDANLIDQTIAGFRARAGTEAQRRDEATMVDSYFCICFATNAQREAFIDAVGWRPIHNRYIDGRQAARILGIDLPPDPEWKPLKRDATWDEFAMTVEENLALPE